MASHPCCVCPTPLSTHAWIEGLEQACGAPATMEVIPNAVKLRPPACMTSARSTTIGDAMPPTRAAAEFAPSAALRTTVGKSSVVYTNIRANAAATPNLPVTAAMMRSVAEALPTSPFGITAHSRHAMPQTTKAISDSSRLPSRLMNCRREDVTLRWPLLRCSVPQDTHVESTAFRQRTAQNIPKHSTQGLKGEPASMRKAHNGTSDSLSRNSFHTCTRFGVSMQHSQSFRILHR